MVGKISSLDLARKIKVVFLGGSSIDFNNQSMTIEFCKEDEILYTEDSVKEFIKKLDMIAERHSFMKTLEPREYKVEDVKKVI